MSGREFRLYDTMSKEVKPVTTLEPEHLKFYTCGPTVYSYAHIGNFRSFLTADLIVRTATALGWRTSWVSNITDVGHLTEDDVADAGGEDRMEKALKSKEGEMFANVWSLAEYYEKAFLEDWSRLNLVEPMVRPKATQHVREQIQMTQELIDKGFAYETPTGVYFDVSSKPDYGKLSGNTQEKLQEAVREIVIDDNKKRQADFALWKKDDKHLMQWFSPWGWGFPGWHIECSAMSRAYLGDTFDLHSGGEDNAFPHHECEIAQSEAVTGKTFCNHWVHARFLQVEGEKMAKRTGNFFTVRDLVERGYDPIAIRYALISVPYGKPMNFTMQLLKDAQGNVDRLRECRKKLGDSVEAKAGNSAFSLNLAKIYDAALEAMCNDLNTSVAISKAIEGAKEILRMPILTDEQAKASKHFLDQIESLLGICPSQIMADNLPSEPTSPMIDDKSIEEWIAERAEAKSAKDFAKSDLIRNMLSDAGFELRDSPEGTTWVKKLT